jgi:hypothetical protein
MDGDLRIRFVASVPNHLLGGGNQGLSVRWHCALTRWEKWPPPLYRNEAAITIGTCPKLVGDHSAAAICIGKIGDVFSYAFSTTDEDPGRSFWIMLFYRKINALLSQDCCLLDNVRIVAHKLKN